MPPPTQPMPKALRRLLKTSWDIDGSSAWHLSSPADRRALRHYGEGDLGGPFPAEELAELSGISMFAGLISEDGSAINGGTEDALVDFCRDTYAAYAKLKERLGELRAPVAP